LAQTPSPSIKVLVKVPSYILPEPQEGDLDLRIASSQLINLANFKTS
jgi:hypothetical protein